MMPRIIAAVILTPLLAGCSGGGAPSTTVGTDATPTSPRICATTQ